jgi:hypothetical protein
MPGIEHRGDDDEGGYTLEELRAMGVEFVSPDDHDAFDREMAAQLQEVDAELVAREGSDALTSDRLLRQVALTAERDPSFLASALAGFRERRGLDPNGLAAWLGIGPDRLAALALYRRPDPASDQFAADVAAISERFGVQEGRLAEALAGAA